MVAGQHMHVILSGVLGATASAIAKLALGTGKDALLHQWFAGVCEAHILPSDGRDLDEWLISRVNRFLGQIMIKHGIVLMDKWKSCQLFIQDIAFRLNIVEVDYCAALELIPRVVCLVLVVICNLWMVAFFVKGLVSSGSVAGTTLASAANFAFSALLGALIWKERFSETWWMGLLSVVVGVILLSTVQPKDDANNSARKNGSTNYKYNKNKAATTTTTRNQPTRRRDIHPPPAPTSSFLPKMIFAKNSNSSNNKSATSSSKQQQQQTVFKQRSKPAEKPGFFGRITAKKIKKPILVDRTFCNECPLCEGQLFDTTTGESPMAIADMSPNCFHLVHAKCLKQSGSTPTNGSGPSSGGGLRSSGSKSGCPICNKSISMWISAKQAAHFAAFWVERVEACLQAMGPSTDSDGNVKPRPAQELRDVLQQDSTLTKVQKQYIEDDPTGLGKGLASALEWGGYVDYNTCSTEKIGWSKHLRSRGIWCYNAKRDDLWLWEWGKIHPRQRCEGCQFLNKDLPIACPDCQGSCEAAFYCSESCRKRDWQRHKMMCGDWQQHGPNAQSE
mmetsp:Transcript_13986/g.39813  ORF Transcript_13986/g.39813 Transcript_13986/m.39813 type:complete len:560 (+) Transcript_13986:314-1993(+)